MNISDQVAVAISGYLATKTLSGNPTIINGMSVELNSEENSRICVVGSQSTLYKPSLPGLYTVQGTVYVIQSVDTENGVTLFDSLCDEIQEAIGCKFLMPQIIAGQDPDLSVYTYNFTGSTLSASARQFMAAYSWDCLARNHTNTIR